MAEGGGCAREYAEAAQKALASELAEIERIAVREYLVGRGVLSYKEFSNAVTKDFGERFEPYTMSLWQTAAETYTKLRAKNPSLLPEIVVKPADLVPDYHNLGYLSDTEAGKLAVENLVSMAKIGRLKNFRGDYDVKPLSESYKKAEEAIDSPAVLQAISRQFDIPFDDVVNAQRLMMDALIYEQRTKNIAVEVALSELEAAKEREKRTPGSAATEVIKAEQAVAEALTQSRMVADMARFYTGLSQGNLTAAGRALRMARETAMLRRSGAAGEAFVALFGNASMKRPMPRTETTEEALKVAAEMTPEKSSAVVEKAREAKEKRTSAVERQDNKISGKFGAKDLFGDNVPTAPMTPREKAHSVKEAKIALKKSGVRVVKEDTAALDRLTESAKRLKALLGKKEGLC